MFYLFLINYELEIAGHLFNIIYLLFINQLTHQSSVQDRISEN